MEELGSRKLDRNFDWTFSGLYDAQRMKACKGFVNRIKESHEPHFVPVSIGNLTLTESQRKAIIFFKEFVRRCSIKSDFAIISGAAGSGKTFMLRCFQSVLHDLHIPFISTSVTGSNCNNIEGTITVHSALSVSYPKQNYQNILETSVSEQTKQKYRYVKYFFLDEFSLVSAQFLNFINLRLQQIKECEEPFGSLNFILCGDLNQLPTIYGTPLWSERSQTEDDFAIEGLELYKKIKNVIFLEGSVRQCGDTRFQSILQRCRYKTVNLEDVEFLETRLASRLPPEELKAFAESKQIYFTNYVVSRANEKKIRNLNTPIYKAIVKQYPDRPKIPEKCDLYLGPGVEVSLTRNIHCPSGLVSGLSGTVKHVVFKQNYNLQNDLPEFVTVDFNPSYRGVRLEDGTVPIPIFRDTVLCDDLGKRISFNYVCLRNDYSLTVHRSQGQTYDKIVTRICDSEFTSFLRYVATSRVRSLSSIVFLDKQLSPEIFNANRRRAKPIWDEERRLKKLTVI